mmetsp:Transcript_29368/g.33771  ORF Transcript_29368/g.33771 Transcript_29368/m.33771 type:complete len:282 (+) Transcript_29368:152-997(+)
MVTPTFISFLFLCVLLCSLAIIDIILVEGRLTASSSFPRSNGNENQKNNDDATTVLASAGTAVASKLNSFVQSSKESLLCDHIRPDELPSECDCRQPGTYVLIIECLKTFNSTYLNDTIGMKIDIDPCNSEGSKVSIDVTEKDHNIDFPIAGLRAGENKNIPIPGLSFIVPTIGHVGIDAAVLIAGNPDKLTLKIGLNACAQLTSHQICASSIPGLSNILPWYVLSGTYSFGDICGSSSNSSKNNKKENEDTDEVNDTDTDAGSSSSSSKKTFQLQAGMIE